MRNALKIVVGLAIFSISSVLFAQDPENLTRSQRLERIVKHEQAVFIKDGWIRDPYIVNGPDGWFYLTGTIPEDFETKKLTLETVGLGGNGVVHGKPLSTKAKSESEKNNICKDPGGMRLFRSRNLVDWEYLGIKFKLNESPNFSRMEGHQGFKLITKGKWRAVYSPYSHVWRLYDSVKDPLETEDLATVYPKVLDEILKKDYVRVCDRFNEKMKSESFWAPELHWLGDRWALIHCPHYLSNLAFSVNEEIDGNWTYVNPELFRGLHDPSLFIDGDHVYVIYGYKGIYIAELKPDFSGFAGEPRRVDPKGHCIGHEGTLLKKIGNKYVYFGTAWSTDQGRKGSYNLYYCVADDVFGPYSERRFVGRFLGHGFPFQDNFGNWWCTAFFNGDALPLPKEGIEDKNLGELAQTINAQGTTIVPLEVKVHEDGDVFIRAIDEAYRNPGPDEVQNFEKF